MIEAGILIAVCAILNRMGGSLDKRYRRIGIPLLITLYGLWRHQWLSLLSLPYGFAIFCLPITLVGDEILTDGRTKLGFEKNGKVEVSFSASFPTKWVNLAWLPVLGILIGSIPCWINYSIYSIVYGIVFGLFVTLSNIPKTADIFKWDRVELFLGGSLGFLTYLVTNG